MHAIETTDLTRFYGEVRGIEDVSLTVESGEIFGFLGPNGAGKTTLIRTLLGFMSPTAGGATVLGTDVTDEDALVETRRKVGYLPGDPTFDEDVTGRRVLDLHAAIKGESRRADLLDIFEPPLDRRVGEYSRGNRQMLGLIQAFMHDPELVILDEPTSGLDPLKQAEFNDFVAAERDQGTTVFFSSHVLSEVRRVCDRVGIVRDGHLVEVADVAALLDRSGRLVTVDVGDDVSPEDFAVDGVHDLVVDDHVRFVYTGKYDALIDALADLQVRDLEIREAPLEEVFMRFYEESPGEGPGTAGPQTGAGAAEPGDESGPTGGDADV